MMQISRTKVPRNFSAITHFQPHPPQSLYYIGVALSGGKRLGTVPADTMKILKAVAFDAIIAGLTACSAVGSVSWSPRLEVTRLDGQAAPQILHDYSLHSISFAVPADMTVSEANSCYPITDIACRGDPVGNRPQQIDEIFQPLAAVRRWRLTI